MADKASRGLVIYGDGLARFVDENNTHLHSLASRASCGFLSLPHSPPSESEDARIIREFLNLLDACEDSSTMTVASQDTLSISERFMGVRAALLTENSSLKSCGGKLGLSVLQWNELTKSSLPFADLPVDFVASELLQLLGFEGGKVLETSQFDLVFVHIGACEEAKGKYIEYINSLVGGVMLLSKPGSEIGSRLHLSVILSYGATSEDDKSNLCIENLKHNSNSSFSVLFPRQSYTMKGSNMRKNVRHHSPMLTAQWQSGVTRKDMVERFTFEDFKENGGNLIIPADRFIHEVAFKLWKAPKYGA